MALLEIENLKKGYASPEGEWSPIIDVPSFELEAGAQVGLRGTSGCGKTTFLNLIAGILNADEGSIRIGSAELTALGESARDQLRARSIGYIFQTFNLLAAYNSLENVLLGMMFGSRVDEAFARHLLERVGLGNRMTYRPGQLSIGQQQRVAVARAMANRPELVLADEPTGNLDPTHAREALHLIRDMCKENDAALLLVSHDQGVLESFESLTDFTEINCA